jgi:predicted nucleic-acid-binding Zn-ribbon protein
MINKRVKRLRNYHKLTNIQKNEILHTYCKKCRNKLCTDIHDESSGEICLIVDNYFKE